MHFKPVAAIGCLLNCITFIIAQNTLPLEKFNLRSIGPAGMSGRVTSIALSKFDKNQIYIGAASGGVWKSTNGGISFVPVFDHADIQSIGALATDPVRSDIVWAGTGEGNPRNSQNSGNGIYKSLDGGKTWKNMGLKNSKAIHRILIHPKNPDIVYAGVLGNSWANSEERGVYKTTDGGKTWERILFSNNQSGCAELIMDPSNPDKLFAALWQFQRKPYFFTSGGEGSGLYVTHDGGANWTRLSEKNGLPKGKLGRFGISIAPSLTSRIYTIAESAEGLGFYRSDDGGNNFYKVSTSPNMGNRPFYYSEIYTDPTNENRIYSLWSQVAQSEDGGKTWNILADWGHIHPDHHAFYIDPDNPKYLINGNDGGLNISYDQGKSWRFIENLPLGQFYHINVDDEIPYNVYGGLQDNGSWKGPGFLFSHSGILNSHWQELLFGDGFDVIPLPEEPHKGYAAYQGGNIYFYNLKTGANQFIQPVHPQGTYLRYNWNAAMNIDPFNKNGIYVGSQFVHYSKDNGMSWEIISPDLSTNDTAKLHQEKSGGLTIDATNAENYCTIISISPSSLNPEIIWAGTDDGQVQVTNDKGKSWTNTTANFKDLPKNSWICQVKPSLKNEKECWVVANNYRQGDWGVYVYKTTDLGKTWKRIDHAGIHGYALSVLADANSKLVFLGTERGLYVSNDEGNTFKKWEKFPSVSVQDMVIQEKEKDLVIGTFGRSIYILDDLEALRKLSDQPTKKSSKIISLSHAYYANFLRASGPHFEADESYTGANKKTGSQLFIFLDTSLFAKGKKTKFTFEIKNNAKQTLRTWHQEIDSAGLHQLTINWNRDGFHFPGLGEIKKDDDAPQGSALPPGTYMLVVSCKKFRDSIEGAYLQAPQSSFSATSETQKNLLRDSFKKVAERARSNFDLLKKMEQRINFIEKVDFMNDSLTSEIRKTGNALKDSLRQYKLLFTLPPETYYYEEITVRIIGKLYETWGYIESDDMPGKNAENAIYNCEILNKEAGQKINHFFEQHYKPFLEKAKSGSIKWWEEK